MWSKRELTGLSKLHFAWHYGSIKAAAIQSGQGNVPEPVLIDGRLALYVFSAARFSHHAVISWTEITAANQNDGGQPKTEKKTLPFSFELNIDDH